MTAREYAKSVGFEVVGKLARRVTKHSKYDVTKGDVIDINVVFYIDEAENEYHKVKNDWCIITADGACI